MQSFGFMLHVAWFVREISYWNIVAFFAKMSYLIRAYSFCRSQFLYVFAGKFADMYM